MVSSRSHGPAGARVAVALAVVLAAACSVGHGRGEVTGQIRIEGCTGVTSYSLRPTFFSAQPIEELLEIRVQRGSDLEKFSDGLHLLVRDADAVKRAIERQLIPSLPVQPVEDDVSGLGYVSVTLFLNETCPRDRGANTVALPAVSGSVRFEKIYAPRVDPDEVEILLYLEGLRFESPEDPEGSWATLDGFINFLYTRGKPAQPFP